MADFEKVISFIVKRNEGGLSTDKTDPGNYRGFIVKNGLFLGTNHGISGALLCTLYPKLSDAEIRAKIVNMTYQEAVFIYKRQFWNDSRLEGVLNNSIAYQFMDHLINAGPIGLGKVITILKSKYKFFTTGTTTVKGVSKTFKKIFSASEINNINLMDSEAFYKDIQVARVQAYPAVYEDQRERPLRWRYEKKKINPKQKSGIRNSSSVWDWLSSSFSDKKFRL